MRHRQWRKLMPFDVDAPASMRGCHGLIDARSSTTNAARVLLHVAELLALRETVPADVDGVLVGVVAEGAGTTCGWPSRPVVASRPSI
jgi:hypothetical protein